MTSYSKFHTGMYRSFQALGKDEQLGRYTGGAYTDAVTIDKYKIEYSEDDVDAHLLLWNPDRPCVNASIDKREKSAVLNIGNYSPKCTIDGKMARGEGTRNMIHFFLNVLKEKGVKLVELDDKSYVTCNNKKIRLGLMYFFKYGETWYEHYFNFKPSDKYRAKYEDMKKRRLMLGDLSEKPCDYFTDDVIDDLSSRIGFVFFYNIGWELNLK